MPRTPEETLSLFNRWATTYDTDLTDDSGKHSGPLAGYKESLLEASSVLPVDGKARVLDVGVGTGAFSRLLSIRGAEIHGVDPSENMLSICRQNFPDFTLRTGTFTNTTYGPNEFDGVVSSFSAHEVSLEDRGRACKEVARITKPGGFLSLLDIMFASVRSREAAKTALGRYWDDEEDYPLIADLDQVFRESGFTNTFWRQTALCHWFVICRRNL